MLRQLLSHSVVYGAATVVSRGSMLLTLLLVALILDPADYGVLGMVAVVSALAALIVPMEISQGLARYYATADAQERPAWAGAAFHFTLAALAVFLLVSEAFAPIITQWLLGDLRYLSALRIAFLTMTLTVLLYFVQAQLRWQFRAGDFVVISLVHALLTVVGSLGLGLLMSPALNGVLLGQALGAGVACAVGIPRIRDSLAWPIDGTKLQRMLRFSLPLVPASLAIFMATYAARIFLNRYEGLEAVGVFTLASQIAGVITLIIVGVQAALTPLVMAHHAAPETPAALATAFQAVTALALVLAVALGLGAQEAVRLFGLADYAAASPWVFVLAPALLMREMYIFFPGFAVSRRTCWQMTVSLISSALGVMCIAVLSQIFGLAGAAWGTLLASTLFLTLWFATGQRLYPVPVRWGKVAAGVGVAVAFMLFGLYADRQTVVLRLSVKIGLLCAVAASMWVLGLVPRTFISSAVAGVRSSRS